MTNPPLVGLHTDFHDYYDHAFAARWQGAKHTFERTSTQGLGRREMLTYLGFLGLTTPLYGKVRDLVAHFRSVHDAVILQLVDLVVYTDPRAHAGEGKVKLSLDEALAQYPDCLASEHVPATMNGTGQSLRYLRIGTRQFWLRYTSRDDWRSNCGEVEIELLSEEEPKQIGDLGRIGLPLFAVDFVSAGKALYAMDFNTAPGLRGTGVEDRLTPTEVYQEIANVITHAPGVQ